MGVGVGVGVGPGGGVGVGDPLTEATRGFRTGAVAVLVIVSEPPKKPPINGVRNVKGWVTVRGPVLPDPPAKSEA